MTYFKDKRKENETMEQLKQQYEAKENEISHNTVTNRKTQRQIG